VTTQEDAHASAKGIPAGRIGSAEEMAATIAFLAGPVAAAYAGQTLHPNGGKVRCST
jgi:3-oxoacyl-[acyl-carrier protein] reductase